MNMIGNAGGRMPGGLNRADDKIGRGKALWQLACNTGRIASNAGRGAFRNPAGLVRNSLVFSSLVLVLSRILIAHLSAHQAKGTSEGPYRYREAVRTTMREFLGWLLSFGVLRAIEGVAKWRITKHFGINAPKSALGQWLEACGKAMRGVSHEVKKLGEDRFEIADLTFTNTESFNKWKPRLQKLRHLQGMPDAEILRSVLRWAPPLIGMIPTILLSGYALERFTRDYSDDVVNFLSRRGGGKATRKTAQPADSFSSIPAGPGLSHFMSNIQKRQMSRIISEFSSPFSSQGQ